MLNDFNASKVIRDSRTKGKQEVITPILKELKPRYSKDFTILVMPCLYGNEVYHAIEHGVPPENIFALECDKEVHDEIVQCKRKDRKVLKGIQTTLKPELAFRSIDEAYYTHKKKYDFIYLDYWSKVGYMDYKNTILKIFKLKLLKPKGILIITSGKNRCAKNDHKFNKEFNYLLNKKQGNSICKALMQAAIVKSSHRKPSRQIQSIIYKSKGGGNRKMEYTTTIARF